MARHTGGVQGQRDVEIKTSDSSGDGLEIVRVFAWKIHLHLRCNNNTHLDNTLKQLNCFFLSVISQLDGK